MPEDDDGAAPQRRRRVEGGRPNKHTVRFTDAEQQLVAAAADAAGMTVPALAARTLTI